MSSRGREILIVEDDADIRDLVSGLLQDEGYDTRQASTSIDALALFNARKPSLVILDVWLKGSEMDGIEILDHIKSVDSDMPVIIISGHGTVETAVAAIRKGAYDYLEKPFKSEKLLLTVERALEASQLRQENRELRGRSVREDELIGMSAVVCHLRQRLDRIAPTNSRVLITGPSGAGKELLARLIHQKSNRAQGPFIAINAATMVASRVEEELFGVSSQSGNPMKVGLLERAHGGTLYVDEVSDMPLETQGKLLRLLVDQTFRRLGGTSDVKVDVRLITSSSRPLEDEATDGKFREDLYHRLNVVPLKAPPLSDRREDIPELVRFFISRLAASSGLPLRQIGDDAMAALQAHDWPGNVRQLRNNVERLLILSMGDADDPITLDTLPPEVSIVRGGDAGSRSDKMIALPLRDARENFEREYLQAQIERFGGNVSRTAEFVGMERSALHRKLKTLGVSATVAKNRGD